MPVERPSRRARLLVLATALGVVAAACSSNGLNRPTTEASTLPTSGGPRPTTPKPSPTIDPATVRPFAGLLLIADRGNNRLIVVTPKKKIVWEYPAPNLPPPPFRFYFPDDAFWVHGGHAILLNEEDNDVLAEIAYPSGETIWTYGHPGVPGSAPGYLHQPDDAYPTLDGGVTVADAHNCRLLFFNPAGRVIKQIGETENPDVPNVCIHDIPRRIGYPNGDTPLPNGDFLVSELRGGWISEIKPDGTQVWATQLPGLSLPSDPQRLADGSYLVVDYNTPGKVIRFTSGGKVLWSYGPTSGDGELSNPSLGAPMPNGLIAVNDDFAHRVVLIDPATNAIVWQYGHKDAKGTAPGFLDTPDGLDLLLPNGTAPLHIDFPSATVTPGRP